MEKRIFPQQTPYDSPWSRKEQFKILLWEYVWFVFCSWTPKPLNKWRLFWLKVFGATVYGRPFVHQRARIQIPWNLILYHRACLGDRANAYSLGKIEIHEDATVGQEVYLCTGTHAFERKSLNLVTSPIIIGANSFIGARAFILPGITIGVNTVIGAASVVTKDMPDNMICAGQPCKPLKERIITD